MYRPGPCQLEREDVSGIPYGHDTEHCFALASLRRTVARFAAIISFATTVVHLTSLYHDRLFDDVLPNASGGVLVSIPTVVGKMWYTMCLGKRQTSQDKNQTR